MAYNFKPCDREQMMLLPPSLADWLPEGHLAWFVLDAVGEMDLRAFYEKYRSDGHGQAAFEPSMMVALLLYAYCEGARSSRQIEKLCERDIAYRVVTANQKPDHTTIARFRAQHQEKLHGLFIEVLKLCAAAGLVKLGAVALDGTKVKADASLAANRAEAHIEEEVRRMLSEAASTDAAEDDLYGVLKRGDELPEGLRDRRSRLVRLTECKARLEREREDARRAQEEKIEKRAREEAASGVKKRGRKPKSPEDVERQADIAKANVTDPESRIMKTREGYVQGYNAQAVVTGDQIIVAADVTQEENDVHQLHPMIEQAEANRKAADAEDEIGVGLADAGYWSEENMGGAGATLQSSSLRGASSEGPELLVATTKDWKQRKALRERPPPRGRIPGGLSVRDRMERRLLTKRGRELYRKRSETVEPVFGQIKSVRGCDGFMRRGVEACRSEWLLITATHNLLKLWRSGRACWN